MEQIENIKSKAHEFYSLMNTRRTVRDFCDHDIDDELLLECIKTAGTAPSGANRQPWFFAVVKDQKIKREIRLAAEKEEFDFYTKRADTRFLDDLKPFSVSWDKPHLEEASALIVIFSKSYELDEGEKKRCYYPSESVGIATGILITALHRLGFATLTHTPNPMKFLTQILDRPKGEKPYLILVVGKRASDYKAPDIERKNIGQISRIY